MERLISAHSFRGVSVDRGEGGWHNSICWGEGGKGLFMEERSRMQEPAWVGGGRRQRPTSSPAVEMLGKLGLCARLRVPVISPESTLRHPEGLRAVARSAEPRGLRFLLVKTFCIRWQLLSAPPESRNCWRHADQVIRTCRCHRAKWLLGGYNGQEARTNSSDLQPAM